MAYLRHSNCRICKHEDHKIVSDIDLKLLDGASINDILGEYSSLFGKNDKDNQPTAPLNYSSVFTHRKHIRKDVASAYLGLPEAGSRGTEIVKGERAVGFDSYVEELRKNKETLDVLLQSAFEDLNLSDDYLLKTVTPKSQALMLSVRDNIRKSIAELTHRVQEATTPTFNNLSGKNNPQIVELLMIVKKVAALSIRDKEVREAFKKELTIQIAYSRDLKWLVED